MSVTTVSDTVELTGIDAVLDRVTHVQTAEQASAIFMDLLVETFRPMGEKGMDLVYHLALTADEPEASRLRDVWLRLFGCELPVR